MAQITLKTRWHLIAHYFLAAIIAMIICSELRSRPYDTGTTGTLPNEASPELMLTRSFN